MKKLRILLALPAFVTLSIVSAAPDTNVGTKPLMAAPVKQAVPAIVSESLTIRYVDPYKVIPSLEQWKDERIRIQKELEGRTAQIEELKMTYAKKTNEVQSKGNLLNDAAKQTVREELMSLENNIQIKQQSFQEYAERVTQEAQMSIFREIETATKEYAQEQKIDFVFAGGALYVNEKFDISQLIADRMNAKYLASKKGNSQPTTQPVQQPAQTNQPVKLKN